jgi:hypothetical protein
MFFLIAPDSSLSHFNLFALFKIYENGEITVVGEFSLGAK